MDQLEISCPAKVNLFFEILGRRSDGYHDVETVMQPVGLCDRLVFRKRPRGCGIRCDNPLIPSDRSNLVFKAFELLSYEAGLKGGIDVEIEKRIPAGSGLGGGSSDAAGALAACNLLYGLGLTHDELVEIAAGIGADVPFFARLLNSDMTGFSGNAFIGEGRGDKLTEAGCLYDVWFVIVYPGFAVSTASAYGMLDLDLTEQTMDIRIVLKSIKENDIQGVAEGLFNRFESYIEAEHPVVSEIKRALIGGGALGALMTGSGSAVFGIASGRDEAVEISKKVLAERKEVEVYVTGTLC